MKEKVKEIIADILPDMMLTIVMVFIIFIGIAAVVCVGEAAFTIREAIESGVK